MYVDYEKKSCSLILFAVSRSTDLPCSGLKCSILCFLFDNIFTIASNMLPFHFGIITPNSAIMNTRSILNERSASYQNIVEDSHEIRLVDEEDEDHWVKICRVCGDKAISNNFGVIACESCKAFFRRTIPRANDLQCAYGDNCPIDINTRRRCQKCRLHKCYEVGMAPENAQKRCRRRLSDGSVNYEDLDSDDADKTTSVMPYGCKVSVADDKESISVSIRLPKQLQEKVGEHLAHGVQMLLQAAVNAVAPDDTTEIASNDWVSAVNEANVQTDSGPEVEYMGSKSLHQKRPADDCVDQSKHPRTSTNCPRRNTEDALELQTGVNDFSSEVASQFGLFPFCKTSFGIECQDVATIEVPSFLPTRMKYVKLEELLLASDVMRNWKSGFPPLEGYSLETFTLTDVYNMVYFSHAYALNQHRQLVSIQELSKVDKAALLRMRIAEVVLIHFSIKHNMTTGQTEIGYPGTPTVPVDLSKKVNGDFANETMRFKYSFPDSLRRNESIYVILCALALFNPDDVQLQDKGAVNDERQLYLILLKQYLESTLGTREARWAYKYLITWLNSVSLWTRAENLRSLYEIDQSTLDICKITLNGWMR